MLEIETVILLIISFVLLIFVVLKHRQVQIQKSKISILQKYNTLINAINLPIFYKDKNSKITECNKAFTVSFGDYKKEAFKELDYLTTSQTKEIDLVYDNNITKSTLVYYTNYLEGSIGILFDTNDAKKNYIKILEQKNKLEHSLKGSQEGYWEWNVKTDELIFSQKAKEILKYKENEEPPKNIAEWMSLVDAYDIAKTNEAFASHLNGKSTWIDVEHRLRTSNDDIWISIKGEATYNNQRPNKVYGTIRDISKEKIKLVTLEKERNLYTTFLDNLPALAFIKDKTGKYIYMNNFYQRLLGFKHWQKKTTREIFGEKVSKSIEESDREAFYQGKFKHEESIPNEEGERRLFETYKFPIDNNHEKVLSGFGLDITKEKIYLEKINLYAKVFDTTNEGIIITDSQNKIISVNKAFYEISGYSEKEVLGKNPNIRKSHHNDKIYKNMWKALQSKGVWTGELFNTNKNGTIVPELMNINVIKNENNEITNYVGIFQSIQKQKKTESQLKQMAHYDVLTNLPNRTLFNDRLDKAIKRINRDGGILGVVFVDLDDFKIVNDTKGHNAGDIVLKETSLRLINSVRDTDTVARLGGDEFVIILEKIGEISDITPIAEKIISEIKKPIDVKEDNFAFVGASLGISIYPNQAKNKKELLEFADIAMYQSKKDGKSCYTIYSN